MNQLLLDILSRKRPAGSETEHQFVSEFIDTIPNMRVDKYGNRILICESSETIISCHTDTVHDSDGIQELYETDKGLVGIINDPTEDWYGECLGADDGAGVYIAMRMIQAGVKATYIFHRDEEIGGLGSAWLAHNMPKFLAKHKRCIAFDRRGTNDIIQYQRGTRCCSHKFVKALSKMLGMKHKGASGSFTDSANYTKLIPECSNVSVGYYDEHSDLETLDTVYLEKLIKVLCKVDLESLPTKRKCDDIEMERDTWRLKAQSNFQFTFDPSDYLESYQESIIGEYDTMPNPYKWHPIESPKNLSKRDRKAERKAMKDKLIIL